MLASPAHGKGFNVEQGKLPLLFRIIGFFWNQGVTPQSGVRFAGPFGSKLVRGFFRMRYRNNGFEESELDAFAAYTVSGR